MRPGLRVNHPGNRVEGEDPLGTGTIAIDVKGHPLVKEHAVGAGAHLVEFIGMSHQEFGQDARIARLWMAVTVEHLVIGCAMRFVRCPKRHHVAQPNGITFNDGSVDFHDFALSQGPSPTSLDCVGKECA